MSIAASLKGIPAHMHEKAKMKEDRSTLHNRHVIPGRQGSKNEFQHYAQLRVYPDLDI